MECCVEIGLSAARILVGDFSDDGLDVVVRLVVLVIVDTVVFHGLRASAHLPHELEVQPVHHYLCFVKLAIKLLIVVVMVVLLQLILDEKGVVSPVLQQSLPILLAHLHPKSADTLEDSPGTFGLDASP